MIGINHTFYFAHRIAWAMTYGEWPDVIDHVNQIHDDNRIANLRSVSVEENRKNVPLYRNNKSGVMGVSRFGKTGKWRASVGDSSKASSFIGSFDSLEDAVAARQKALIERGYHPNHGK
jgi:hypothetical protein